MIAFTRDGRYVLLQDGDAINVVQLEGGSAERTFDVSPERMGGGVDAGPTSFAAFDDEIWIVTGAPPRLRRFGFDGVVRGEPVELPPGEALLPAAFGDPSALWMGPAPVELLLERGGLVRMDLAPMSWPPIVIAPGRSITLEDGAFVLRQGEVRQVLSAAGDHGGAILLGGAALLDEKWVAALVQLGGIQQMLVMSPRDGAIQHRLPLSTESEVRKAVFAPRRGHAVLLSGERRLTIIDLRFGRTLKAWEEPGPVVDFAVDAGARHLVVQRSAEGGEIDTFYGSYREILNAITQPSARSAAEAEALDAIRVGGIVPAANGGSSERGGGDAGADEPGTSGAGQSPRAAVTDGGEPAEADSLSDDDAVARSEGPPLSPAPPAKRLVPPVLAAARAAAATPPPRAPASELRPPAPRPRAAPLPVDDSKRLSPFARPPAPRPTLAPRPATPTSSAAPDQDVATPDPTNAIPTPTSPAPDAAGAARASNEAAADATVESRSRAAAKSEAPTAARSNPLATGDSAAAGRTESIAAGPIATAALAAPATAATNARAPSTSPGASSSTQPVEVSLDDDILVPNLDRPDEELALVAAFVGRALADTAARLGGTGRARVLLAVAERLAPAGRSSVAAGPRRARRLAIASELGLSPLAADILLVASAPALYGDLGRLYALAALDAPGATRARADEALIARLLDTNADAVAHELDRNAPLRRFGVLSVNGGARPFATIEPHSIVLRRMRGEPRESLDEAGRVTVLGSDTPLEKLPLPPGVLGALLAAFESGGAKARVALRGPSGSGRRSVLAALAARRGRSLAIIDAARFFGSSTEALSTGASALRAEAGSALAAALGGAALDGCIPCIIHFEVLHDDSLCSAALYDVIAAHPGPILLAAASGAALPLPPSECVVLELPAPGTAARGERVRAALARHGLPEGAAGEIAARFAPGWEALEGACASATAAPTDSAQSIMEALDRGRDRRLEGLMRRVARLPRADDLILAPATENALHALAAWVRSGAGKDATGGDGEAAVALFEGPAGTGKTSAALALAGELGLTVYRTSGASLFAGGARSIADRLRTIAGAAAGGGTLLLVEDWAWTDAAAVGGPAVLSAFERFLEEVAGVVVLECAWPGGEPPPALARRITLRVGFPLPDEHQRERLLARLLPPDAQIAPADLRRLSSAQRSGGALRRAMDMASRLAIDEGAPLAAEHIERALALGVSAG